VSFRLLLWLCTALAAAFVLLPVAAVLLGAEGSLGELLSREAMAAVRLSLLTATLSTLVVVLLGTPVAYLLARRRLRLLETALNLPLVLPPAVAGIALLAAFGREGVMGRYLAELGVSLPFTTAAVVVAQSFVALPLYVRSAKAGFAEVSRSLEGVAYTLGAGEMSTFLRVTLPLARGSMLAGIVLSWSRAVGEFGATIMFAGNFAGRTQTMPLAVYSALQVSMQSALAMSALLVMLSLGVLLTFEAVSRRQVNA
jgi:molybdate transport system permease protein